MHELALAHNIVRAALDHAPDNARIEVIAVECGPMSGVVPEALRFGFEVATEAAGLDGVVLDLRLLQARACCPACGERFDIDSMWATCIQCGHAPLTVEGGRELKVVEIQVENRGKDV